MRDKTPKPYCFPKIILKATSTLPSSSYHRWLSLPQCLYTALLRQLFYIPFVPLRLLLTSISSSTLFSKNKQQTDKNNFESHTICYGSRSHTHHFLKIVAPGTFVNTTSVLKLYDIDIHIEDTFNALASQYLGLFSSNDHVLDIIS